MLSIKPILYRTLFLTGLFVFVYSVLHPIFIPSEEYAKFLDSNLYNASTFYTGVWVLFNTYLLVYSLYNFATFSPRPAPYWLIVLLIPVFGTSTYFEKFIIQRGLLTNPAWKLNPIPDIKPDEIIRTSSRRAGAALLDYVIICTFGGWMILALGSWTNPTQKTLAGWEAWYVVLGWTIYFPIAEFLFGRTLGKWLFGVKVVIGNGTKVTFVGAIRRRLLDPLDFLYFTLFSLVRVRSHNVLPRRLGDYWGHTWVVLAKSDVQPPNHFNKKSAIPPSRSAVE